MELQDGFLQELADACPGYYAIYRLEQGKLKTLHHSSNLPGLSGFSDEAYEAITRNDALSLVKESDRMLLHEQFSDKQNGELVVQLSHMQKGVVSVEVAFKRIGSQYGSPVFLTLFHRVENVPKTSLEENERLNDFEAQKKHIEQVLDSIPTGVAICSVKGNAVTTTVINNRLSQMFGLTKDTFTQGTEMAGHVHPDDLPKVLSFMESIRNQTGNIHFDYRFRKKADEAYHWFSVETQMLQREEDSLVFICIQDRSRVKAVEEENYKNRQMYKVAVMVTKTVIWEYDRKTKTMTMQFDNPYTREMCMRLGIPKTTSGDEFLLSDFVESKDKPALEDLLRKVNEGVPEASCEFCYHIHNDPIPHYVQVTCITMYDEENKPFAVFGFGQDITSQRLERKRNLSILNTPDSLGSVRFNLTRNLTGEKQLPPAMTLELPLSGTAEEYFAALAGSITNETIRNEFRSKISRKQLLKDFSEGKTNVAFDFPLRDGDGKRIWCRWTNYLYQNSETGDVESLSYAQDCTKQRRNDEIINLIMDEGFEYIGLINCQMRTFEFLRKTSRITFPEVGQATPYDTCVSYVSSRFVDPEEMAHYQEATSLEIIVRELELHNTYVATYHRKEDKRVICEQINYNWLDKANGEILVTRTNVTTAYEREQKQLREIDEARQVAEKASHSKEEFLSRISHDIRTPISAIIGMTGFAREDADDKQKLLSDLDKIEASSTFLLSLINDVLDISKVDSGKIELHPEPYQMKDYLANIQSIFQPMCQKNGQKLTFVCEKPVCIVADHVRLNQIALNLLSNAVKYTPSGGVITFTIDNRPQKDGLVEMNLEVCDSGIGMSEAFQQKMFLPFTQDTENPLRAGMQLGTGLGLSIVKRITCLMGGSIDVKSKPGMGTDITIHLMMPLYDGTLRPQDIQRVWTEKLHGTVLLAEDNPVNTEIAVRLLSGFGLGVKTASNGLEAVKTFEASSVGEFRVILMDIQMPLLDGYKATEQIRALNRSDAKTIPIIAMTADAFAESVERTLKAGMNAHLTKPINPETLRSVLGKMMG